MKIFLTGGTGFIGSHILMKLLDHGHQVTVLARNKNKIPALNSIKDVTLIEGSVGDYNLIEKSIEGHDVCIHVALYWGDPGSYKMLANDTAASVFLADSAARGGCKSFIYTSSTAVDDYFYMVPRDEREDKLKLISVAYRHRPATYYGATKAATENFMHAISYETKMKVNIVRPGYTFGNPAIQGAPVQGDNRFKDIVLKAKQGENIDIIKFDGTQFIWADDLAEIYIQILKSALNRKTYFGLSKNYITWQFIAEQAVKLTGSKSQIQLIDKGYDGEPSLWDVSNIKKDFGLEFNAEENIKEHVRYYLENFKNY
jgi:UDP-glucose 4-epimerase